MKTTFKKSLLTTSVLAGLASVSNSHAFTVTETDIVSDFSNMPGSANTTNIGNMAGITLLTGNLSQDDVDNFQIQLLPMGVQTINFDVGVTIGSNDVTLQIFEDGSDTNSFIQTYFSAVQSDSYETSIGFEGNLRFEFVHTNEGGGSGSYSIELPTAPVPVPAAALLFASGLGALGAAKARRKAKRRA